MRPSPSEGAAPLERRRAATRFRSEELVRDLQTLLAAAVRRLRQEAGAGAIAWALRADGSPYVAAAAYGGAPPLPPDRSAFATAAGLPGATPLDVEDRDPARAELARQHRCAAAAPVRSSDRRSLAVLLLQRSAGAAARPRSLAALDAAAHRLAGPLSAALAAGRLARLDTEVRRLQQLATLGSLAAEIAHEVRNPLVSVKTFLQLLPERLGDPEFLTRFLELASDEVARMERLLDWALEQARPASGPDPARPAGVADAVAALAELLAHLANERGVAIETGVAAPLPPAALGDDALRQVLLNLALNAIDVTPPGGRVCIEADARAGGIALRVRDGGPGIPHELRGRVFEPFFSTREDRAGGLGLAITRSLVEEVGGRIEIADAPEAGAEFRIELPAVADARA